jgi:mannose-6-phosphate isomerase-like protein (cupin superfamily)
MKPKVIRANSLKEYLTPERCFIFENCGISTGDKKVSIARARVEPGISTKVHHLDRVQEIYLITQGNGRVQIGDLKPTDVFQGDVVIIPPGVLQTITNNGKNDLIFYCVCTPAFTEKCYNDDEGKSQI